MDERMSVRQHVHINLNWFAINFLWGALLPVVIPAQVLALVGEASKELYLGIVFAVGAFVAMVIQPIFGALSDRTRSRLGRRRPYIVAGTVVTLIALLPMAWPVQVSLGTLLVSRLLVYLVGFILLELGSNVASSPYQGLIPDLVPETQRGTASGFMGLMTMLGTCGGAFASGALVSAERVDAAGTVAFYGILAAVVTACAAVTVLKVREKPLIDVPRTSWAEFARGFWVSPRLYPDFAWLFVTRLLVMLGFYTVLYFLEYYLKDVLNLANFTKATASVSIMVMVGAIVSSLEAGWASDRIGRKSIVFVSGLLMAATCLILVTTRSFALVLPFGVVFGLGYGAYISTDWALAVDVLPSSRSAAKDLGIWSIAVTLPQVLAPLIGGFLLFRLKSISPLLGYRVVYSLGIVYFAVGSVLIWKIRKAK